MLGVAEIAGTETGEGGRVVNIAHIEDHSVWYPRHTATTGELHPAAPGVDRLVDVGVG